MRGRVNTSVGSADFHTTGPVSSRDNPQPTKKGGPGFKAAGSLIDWANTLSWDTGDFVGFVRMAPPVVQYRILLAFLALCKSWARTVDEGAHQDEHDYECGITAKRIIEYLEKFE